MRQDYPILEFDPSREAVIEPARILKPRDVPPHCVFCFFQEVLAKLVSDGHARHLTSLRSELGEHPVYEVDADGRRLTAMHPGIGAPMAAAIMEEMIAIGCRRFIACGAAGVLDRDIAVGHVIVPVWAVRDEGTSYHYLPPAREVAAGAEGVRALEVVLREHHCPYLLSKTWTTDAFYRETLTRVQRRRADGCLTVEMEAAAFFAVAQFRGVTCAQILYGGDDVSSDKWDSRNWHSAASVRERLFWLAAEACLRL